MDDDSRKRSHTERIEISQGSSAQQSEASNQILGTDQPNVGYIGANVKSINNSNLGSALNANNRGSRAGSMMSSSSRRGMAIDTLTWKIRQISMASRTNNELSTEDKAVFVAQ